MSIDSGYWFTQEADPFYNEALSKSLRFPAESGGGHLHRTFANNTPSNDWTFSTWIKRSVVGQWSAIFYSSHTGNPYYQSGLTYNSDDQLRYYHGTNTNVPPGGVHNVVQSTYRFRDTSAWYHVVCQRDNDGNTVFYVNGTQVASGSSSSNYRYVNGTTYPHYIGNYTYQSNPDGYFHGYMADTHFVDNALVAPTVFAETSNGVWIPIKDPDVSEYGDNGFRLEYKGTGTATSSGSVANPTNIGDDSSGKNNHWAVSTLTSHDVMPDTPENNFATLNPNVKGYYDLNFGQGCLEVIGNSAGGEATYSINQATMACHMKSYWEVRVQGLSGNGRTGSGLLSEGAHQDLYGSLSTADMAPVAVSHPHGTSNFTLANSDVFTDGESSSQGQIVMWAFDPDSGKVWYGVDGTWAKSGNPATGSNPNTTLSTDLHMLPAVHVQSSSDNCIFNFGQDGTFAGTETAQNNSDGNGHGNFYYAPPSGFLALCTANIPEPTIGSKSATQHDDYFNTAIWDGNAGTQSITGVGFKPDLTWIKGRVTNTNHVWTDSLRGATKEWIANTAAYVETTNADGLTVFGVDGFTVGDDNDYNDNDDKYVAYNWKAGGAPTATNSAGAGQTPTADSVKIDGSNFGSALDGSIPATKLSANTKSGFSIITYTGNGSSGATIAHGLGAVPKVLIIKKLDASAYYGVMYHSHLGPTYETYLALTQAPTESDFWASTTPTTTTFKVSDSSYVNGDTKNYVCYAFAEVEGFSRMGKYIGNGQSSDGPFIYTGFRPAWVWIRATGISNQYIYDSGRSFFNPTGGIGQSSGTPSAGYFLFETYANETGNGIDFLSNGFKIRNNDNSPNQNNVTIMYIALGEKNFKYANAR